MSPHAGSDRVAVQPSSPEVEAWLSNVATVATAAQQGDVAAFERLYQMFAPMVHGLLLARLPLYEVDDVMQDVFFTAFRQLPALREPAAFGGWLAAIARQRSADFFRRTHQTEPLDAASGITSAVDKRLDAQLDARTVLGQIRQLPETYAETLTLRLVEGLTGPEIAAATGLTPDSVRVNLHRGLKLLRERLGLPSGQNWNADSK
ncbi:sigma-70 family RNA polymerase sigma factor [Chloracidobacterium validum]|uniref:Sigma-70 family RNA polymerase sigma factor n=2 Tax=Chloracidobacterium validum TaxID=2821543 RepID=A0ABX8BEA3_9BACT|nr:sigma-70 family RNA polymerase sigma factor [Chloracidobacterium validum]